jgi:hypothetical protein
MPRMKPFAVIKKNGELNAIPTYTKADPLYSSWHLDELKRNTDTGAKFVERLRKYCIYGVEWKRKRPAKHPGDIIFLPNQKLVENILKATHVHVNSKGDLELYQNDTNKGKTIKVGWIAKAHPIADPIRK